MTELTLNEMEEVNSGPLPVIVVAAAQLAGAGFITGLSTAGGFWAWNKFVNLW
jgi:hypothetical protein